MNIFLDTEFTDFPDRECDLISIGLVDEEGREFYAELTDYRQEACSHFVKEVVLPLLKRHPGAVVGKQFDVAIQLNEWLKHYPEANICFDYGLDRDWLAHLLGLLPPEEVTTQLTATNIWGSLDKMKIDWFWKEQYDTQGWVPHQALWDAHGNKFAYKGPVEPSVNK